MLIKVRRKHSRFSLFIAIAFGVGSGVYIWKPYLEEKQQSKLDLEKITKDEINPSSHWKDFKSVCKQKFTFKAWLVIAGLSGIVLFKWKIYPLVKRRKLDETHDMMGKLYAVQREQEAEENWRFT